MQAVVEEAFLKIILRKKFKEYPKIKLSGVPLMWF